MDRIEAEKAARRRRISEEIRDALRDKGLTKKEFASLMHRHPSDVTRWTSGRHNFTSDLLSEISVVLERPIYGEEVSPVPGKHTLVSGYDAKLSSGILEDSGSCVTELVELPVQAADSLKNIARSKGMTFREFISSVLLQKAEENPMSAMEFCGIWSEDMPSAEEIRSMRTHNTFPDIF